MGRAEPSDPPPVVATSATPAAPATEDPTLTETRDVVRIGTLALSIVYLVLLPLHLLLLDGPARVVMAVLASLSAVLCAVLWLRSRSGRGSTTGVLTLVCCVPLVNSLVHIAVTGSLDETTVLELSIVAVAAVHHQARQVTTMVVTAGVVWALLVAFREPLPAADWVHPAAQLALATALAAGIFSIRTAVTHRLVETHHELRSELLTADLLRREAQASGERFLTLFDDSPVGLGLSDEHGLLVEANQALCDVVGERRERLLGRPAAQVIPLDPDDLAGLDDAADGVVSVERRFQRPSGEARWASLTVRHVAGPQGQRWTLTHVRDISDRRADELKLRQSEEMMRAMVDIAHASQRNLDPRPPLLRALTTLAHGPSVSLLECSSEGRLAITAVAGDQSLLGTTVALDEPSVTAEVWRSQEPLFVSETQSQPMVNQRLLALSGASSMLWQPVLSGDTMSGLLVMSWADSVADITDFERQAVAAVAAEAAVALAAETMRHQLERNSVTDSLTGLLNRRGWDQELTRLVSQAQRTGRPFTLALIDLDHFKDFNDTHGHLRGDEALVAFADSAGQVLRDIDVLARWGGDEFAVALRDTGRDDAPAVLDRLRRATPDGLACSIGYTEVHSERDLVRDLDAADLALLAAKRAGRDRTAAAPVDAVDA